MCHNIKTVLSEIYTNRYRLLRLANYELKKQNTETVFGFLWNFFNPALQIFVYWFVFAIGLKAAAPQGGYPYLIWMIAGIMPWFYISTALNTTLISIIAYGGVLKRMRFPMAIVPVKSVISAFIAHIWSMLVVVMIILVSGYELSSCWWQTFYYAFCSIMFLVGYSLLVSAVTVVFRDFQKLMNSVIRLLFYLTPIVWSHETLPEHLKFVLELNPLAYIIDGYRDSLLYGVNITENLSQGCFFWLVTIALFIVGCNVHMKFRKKFIDLI